MALLLFQDNKTYGMQGNRVRLSRQWRGLVCNWSTDIPSNQSDCTTTRYTPDNNRRMNILWFLKLCKYTDKTGITKSQRSVCFISHTSGIKNKNDG